MGLYATTSSIPQLIPFFLSGNDISSDTAGVILFSKHIDRAESRVNACLVARYSLPFTTVPPLVRTLTEDVASYYTVRASYIKDGQLKQEYLDDFLKAEDTLIQIKNGEVKLALTDGSLLPALTISKFLSSSEGQGQIFGVDSATAWKVDADKIDELKDSRT